MPLSGLRVFVTGVTGGIGSLLVRAFVEQGAHVIAHARDERALAAILHDFPSVERRVADLVSLRACASLADSLPNVDVVVHNAGVGFGADRKRRETSADGYELRMAVNYLAPFAIDERLFARGLPAKTSVRVASAGQYPIDFDDPMSERDYDGVLAYRRSKLAMVMDTFERARRDRSRVYVSLHPGTFLATKMVREAGIAPQGTAESGARAVVALTKKAIDGTVASGAYFDVDEEARADDAGYDVAAQERLRTRSLAWIAAAAAD